MSTPSQLPNNAVDFLTATLNSVGATKNIINQISTQSKGTQAERPLQLTGQSLQSHQDQINQIIKYLRAIQFIFNSAPSPFPVDDAVTINGVPVLYAGQAAQQITSDLKGDHLSTHMAGVVGDVKFVIDGHIVSASKTLTSATAAFSAADIGKLVKVYGAGSGRFSPNLYSKIDAFVNATTVTLHDAAARTVSGADVYWGTDYTSHLNGILAVSNALYIPHGTVAFKGPLTVTPGARIYGETKGSGLGPQAGISIDGGFTGCCLMNFSDTEYAFSYLSSPGSVESDNGFTFEDFVLISKNGLLLNQPGVSLDIQAYVLPVTVRFVDFYGDYVFSEDPEALTATLPVSTGTANSLDKYGTGIAAAKVLRLEIQQCLIVGYGMGVWWDGVSNSAIRNHCRLINCGVWVWQYSHGIEGNLAKIIESELITFARVGGIYIQECHGMIIAGNYWEQPQGVDYPSSCYIWSDNDYQLMIGPDNNFLDTYSSTAPTYRVAPRAQAIIFGNNYTRSGQTNQFATIANTNWINTGTWSTMAYVYGNSSDFPVPTDPGFVAVPSADQYLYSAFSPANISGPATTFVPMGHVTPFPWIISPVTGRWVLNTTVNIFDWLPTIQSPAHRDFCVAVTARFLGGMTPLVLNTRYAQFSTTITAITRGATTTITTAAAHGLTTGQQAFLRNIAVSGFSGSSAIGLWTVTVLGPTTFTIPANTSGNDPYHYGGVVYDVTPINNFSGSSTQDTGITLTTDAETKYLFIGLPAGYSTNGFWILEMNNDVAEIEALQLFPFEDRGIIQGRSAQTNPLLSLRTFDGVEQCFTDINGVASNPNIHQNFLFVTGDTTLTVTDRNVVAAPAAATVITLPAVVDAFDFVNNRSIEYCIQNITGAHVVTVTGAGGFTYALVSAGDAIILGCNGVGWSIYGEKHDLTGPLFISKGYGTTDVSVPQVLVIGGGSGSGTQAGSLGWGDGSSGYTLDFYSPLGKTFSFNDVGDFTASSWIGAGIASPSDVQTSLDAADSRFGNVGVNGAADHSGAYPLKVYGAIESTSLTASRPVRSDASKGLISGQIDLGLGTDVTASGLSAGQIMAWDGTKTIGVAGVSVNFTEITSGPTGGTFVTSVSGPGVTFTTATAVTGFGVATHASTNGIVTS